MRAARGSSSRVRGGPRASEGGPGASLDTRGKGSGSRQSQWQSSAAVVSDDLIGSESSVSERVSE